MVSCARRIGALEIPAFGPADIGWVCWSLTVACGSGTVAGPGVSGWVRAPTGVVVVPGVAGRSGTVRAPVGAGAGADGAGAAPAGRGGGAGAPAGRGGGAGAAGAAAEGEGGGAGAGAPSVPVPSSAQGDPHGLLLKRDG
ncbi:MAG: hypothetical protein R3F11_24645 [Verrucomicrobiales bacterium]